MTDSSVGESAGRRRRRRRLSPSEKYEAFVQVTSGEMSVAECADHWGVDRSTVMRARGVAKQGALDALASSRPGVRCRWCGSGVGRCARRGGAAGRGAQGDGGEGDVVGGKRALGVTGEWPPRVGADVKGAALDLVEAATEDGWSARRACATLELDERRWRRWRARSAAGCLDDGAGGGGAVHGILPAERRAILETFERWGDIDGGVRKLAHRGSYEGLVLPARPRREPVPARPLPDWVRWERHQLWVTDLERHEAFLNPAVVRGHRLGLVAAGWLKLRAAGPGGHRGGWKQP